jgi:hypothetical protein
MLDFLFPPDHAGVAGAQRRVVVQRDLRRCDLPELSRMVARLRTGDAMVYAIRLDVPALTRLVSLALLRRRLRQIERAFVSGGARIVARYGVDPNLDAPSCIYDLHTPASDYADRNLRPRGRLVAVRRIAARWLGCDPALGALVLVATRS